MLSRFTYRFRRRFSGTGKYGPPASLSPLSRLSLEIPRRLIPSQPADRRLSPPCGPDEGDGYLIRQRRHTACWQLSMSHADYGWCGPPACLLSVSAPVETGTPPLILRLRCGPGSVKASPTDVASGTGKWLSPAPRRTRRNMAVDTRPRACTIMNDYHEQARCSL